MTAEVQESGNYAKGGSIGISPPCLAKGFVEAPSRDVKPENIIDVSISSQENSRNILAGVADAKAGEDLSDDIFEELPSFKQQRCVSSSTLKKTEKSAAAHGISGINPNQIVRRDSTAEKTSGLAAGTTNIAVDLTPRAALTPGTASL
jgi:hypothetical protein